MKIKPNALGSQDSRRIPIRQRTLHPSMLGFLDCSATSSSDPGRSGSLSPYTNITSMYFDDSLYENEMHYRIAKLLDERPLGDEYEELAIECDNEEEYNNVLDALFKAGENKFKMYGVTNKPFEIIVEEDPTLKYRQFDESNLLDNRINS